MTLRELIVIFGTKAEVARQCRVTPQAVSLWGLDDPVGEVHELRMKYEILPARMAGDAKRKAS